MEENKESKPSIRKRYGCAALDKIFKYFMRTILHLQESGIENLPLEDDFDEPIHTYLSLAIELITDGQPPEAAGLILDAEYDTIVSNGNITAELALALRTIKALSCHIHYDSDYYGYILSTDNLWGNGIFEYAARTFYPNMPDDMRQRYHIDDLIKHMSADMFRRDDY